MAKIPGVPITGQIVPTDTNDTYPTHTDEYGKGGYRSITDVDARNNIPNERRKLGMKVYCIAEDQHFILKDTLDNSGWQVDQGGSGGVTDHDLLSNRGVNRHDDIDAFIYSKGNANGLAPLGADSKIPNQYIPALALMDTQFATSQAEMLALTAQKGDLCIRQDENKTYILIQEPATTLSNWTPLLFPGSVVSVNGKTGIIAIGLADLIDVIVLNPAAKHTIVYNTLSGKFENRLLEVSDINDLVTQLSNKSAVGHQHTLASITDYVSDITSRLSGKANTAHGHAISDITDLTTQLNAINTALSGKAPTSHNHPISNITNLQTELNGKHQGLKIVNASDISTITSEMVVLGTQLYIVAEDKYYKCIDATTPNIITAWKKIDGTEFDSIDFLVTGTPSNIGQMRDRNIQLDMLTDQSLIHINTTKIITANLLSSSDVTLISPTNTSTKIIINDIKIFNITRSGTDYTIPATIKIGTSGNFDNICAAVNLSSSDADFTTSKVKTLTVLNNVIDLNGIPLIMKVTPPVSGWTAMGIYVLLNVTILEL